MKYQNRRYFYHKTDEGFIQVTRFGRKYQFCQYQGGSESPYITYGNKKDMMNLALEAMEEYVMY